MIIESKAPTRVDFAGSTLDIWPLYLFHPGSVTLNAAISLYASCRIETNGNESIRLMSRDIQREESFPSFTALMKTKRYRLPLLAEITKFFRPQGGFTLMTDSEAPAGRSEERRVGKECRCGWWAEHYSENRSGECEG